MFAYQDRWLNQSINQSKAEGVCSIDFMAINATVLGSHFTVTLVVGLQLHKRYCIYKVIVYEAS